jgi:hypothetical protein
MMDLVVWSSIGFALFSEATLWKWWLQCGCTATSVNDLQVLRMMVAVTMILEATVANDDG